MLQEIKAIPTRYKNILFKSRLEARWAVFFDELNIKWQYEPEYGDVEYKGFRIYYKPDFYLSDYDLWIEVKPIRPSHLSDAEIMKIVGWTKSELEMLILVGEPRIISFSNKAHYLYSYNPHRKKALNIDPNIRWCECPKCGKISYRPGGGVPNSCDETCFPEPDTDLFGDELPEPEGDKSQKLKRACYVAKHFKFDE